MKKVMNEKETIQTTSWLKKILHEKQHWILLSDTEGSMFLEPIYFSLAIATDAGTVAKIDVDFANENTGEVSKITCVIIPKSVMPADLLLFSLRLVGAPLPGNFTNAHDVFVLANDKAPSIQFIAAIDSGSYSYSTHVNN